MRPLLAGSPVEIRTGFWAAVPSAATAG